MPKQYKLYVAIQGSDLGPTAWKGDIPRISAPTPDAAIREAKRLVGSVVDEDFDALCCAELFELDPKDDTNIDPPVWELECFGECGYLEEWDE